MHACDLFITGATKNSPFVFKHQLGATGNLEEASFAIDDLPIWVSITTNDDEPINGEIWASLELQINENPVHQLLSGHISGLQGLSWPLSHTNSPNPTRGETAFISSNDPAAGAEISATVPTGQSWILKAVKATLVTSATVANRRVHLRVGGLSNTILDFHSLVDQAASTTRNYSFAHAGASSAAAVNNEIFVAFPAELILTEGCSITTVTDNLQAGDNYGTLGMWVERYAVRQA